MAFTATEWAKSFERFTPQYCREQLDAHQMEEETPYKIGDKVRFAGCTAVGRISYMGSKYDDYCVTFDDGEEAEANDSILVRMPESPLPLCGELYAFTYKSDYEWVDKRGGLEIMADMGFRIYDRWMYIFGIDGGMTEEKLQNLYEARFASDDSQMLAG